MALTDNLYSYHTMDSDGSDSYSTNNWTVVGATAGLGKINKGMSFDGVNDQLNQSYITSFSNSSAFSISMWVYFDSFSAPATNIILFSNSNGGNTRIACFTRADGIVRFSTYNGSAFRFANVNSSSLSTSTWYHIVFTTSGSTNNIYINGTLQTTANAVQTNDSTSGAYLGCFNDGGSNKAFFSGKMDEVALWTRELSATEVTELYNSGEPRIYPFDGAISNRLVSEILMNGDATDSSGNGYDFSVTGATLTTGVDSSSNSAYNFSGTGDDYLEDSDASTYLSGQGALTIETWIKSDVTNTDKGFYRAATSSGADGAAGIDIRYDADSGGTIAFNLKYATGTATRYESATGIQTTNWQHVVVVWQTGTPVKMYIDGSLDTPSTSTGNITGAVTDVQTLIIGKGVKESTTSWDGKIDTFRLWSRPLSSTEISYLYNSGSGRLTSLLATGSSDYGVLKRYNGSTWVAVPKSARKVYNGSSWVAKPFKIYTGTEFLEVGE